jgi:cupin 2 domain-containing protein
MKNLFADLPAALPEELIETLATSATVRIERIVSLGHASPPGFWYDQDQSEFVVLLRGAARISFEDGVFEMVPGSFVDIPAHRRHRVEWTNPEQVTVWLAVHYR